jgi:ferredoxin
MRITVDDSRCIGAGQCVLNAPAVFDQREEDGIVVLLDATPLDGTREEARRAARLCPAGAIAIHED